MRACVRTRARAIERDRAERRRGENEESKEKKSGPAAAPIACHDIRRPHSCKEEAENVGPADFERAISKTGYGRFNVLLFLAVLPLGWAGIFDTTTGAFILASAECDLGLTFFRKGVLVAAPYIGTVATMFLWDYLTPYTGVRNLFVPALLADSLLNVLSTGLDSFYAFILVKFFAGVLAGGPLAMAMPYLTEFHSAKYKPRFSTWAGFLLAVGNIVPAVIGFAILPLPWAVDIFGKRYSPWRIYLLICSIVPVLGLVTASLLPQSPKRLMDLGRTEQALDLLRRMYSINTGNSADTFPIKGLLASGNGARLSRRTFLEMSSEKMRRAWYNTKLLFSTSYLPAVSFLMFLQFGSMLGFNTMRLWVPHLFIILNNFDGENWREERAPTICEMLDHGAARPIGQYRNCSNFDDICIPWTINSVIYQNSSIIATSAVLFSLLAGMISTSKLRKRVLLLTGFLVSVVSSFGINWAQSPPYMLTLAAAIIVTTRIAGNIVTAVNVDVIPIPLRPTSLTILTYVGNVAAILGNFIFSALLGTECLLSFFGLGCFFSACFCVSCFQPKPVRTSPKELA